MPAIDERILIGLLAAVSGMAVAGAIALILRARREARRARERALHDTDEFFAEDDGRQPVFASTIHRVGEAVSSGRTSRSLREKLGRAGYYSESAAVAFLGYKIVLFVLALAGIGLLLAPTGIPLAIKVMLATAIAGVFFFLPNMIVGMRWTRRRREVREHLPDAIDLLDICVSSGTGLDMAWKSVAEEIRRVSPVLANEMELTNLEISLGTDRAVAMRNMAERTGADEVSSLVALLIQSERFGASIVDALKTFAHTMRETRSQRAEEAAEKMTVKLLFPMVIFIFPPLLIVMVGPAVVSFLTVVGGN